MKMQSNTRTRPVPAAPVSPAELRKQVVNYSGRLGPIGSKLQAAVWAR